MVNESETAPIGGTMTPRQIRYLKIAIAIMTVMIIAGFALLIYGLFGRGGNTKDQRAQSTPARAITHVAVPAMLELDTAPGAEIASVLTEQGRLIVLLRMADGGGEIAIVDLASGQEIQRVRLKPER